MNTKESGSDEQSEYSPNQLRDYLSNGSSDCAFCKGRGVSYTVVGTAGCHGDFHACANIIATLTVPSRMRHFADNFRPVPYCL